MTRSDFDRDHDHADGCGHHHGLTSEGAYDNVSDGRLLWSVILNQLLTVAEVIAGVASGSVSLLSDAAHNFADANSLLIAYIARRISRRRADAKFSFGYGRAELIGATINLSLLGATGFFLVCESIHRFMDPQPVIGWLMAWAAGIALVVDLGTAAMLWAMSRGSLNVRAAFVHNLVDAAGSVVVLVGAIAIMRYGWLWVDPTLSLVIAAYIFWQVRTMLPQAVTILMESTPSDVDVKMLKNDLIGIDGVVDLHHVHVWGLDERHVAMEAHVLTDLPDMKSVLAVKTAVKKRLSDEHSIHHSTLEFEWVGHACDDDPSRSRCHVISSQ